MTLNCSKGLWFLQFIGITPKGSFAQITEATAKWHSRALNREVQCLWSYKEAIHKKAYHSYPGICWEILCGRSVCDILWEFLSPHTQRVRLYVLNWTSLEIPGCSNTGLNPISSYHSLTKLPICLCVCVCGHWALERNLTKWKSIWMLYPFLLFLSDAVHLKLADILLFSANVYC